MRNTGGSGRSKSSKDKPQTNNTSTNKSDGLPPKTLQPTAEQLALTNLITKDTDAHDAELQKKIDQIIELTGCSQDRAEIALYDNKNDLDTAVNSLFEGKADEGEWRETGKKKKKQTKVDSTPAENSVDSKPEKRDHKERNDKDNRDRDRDDGDNDRNFREQSDNYRRNRRNDNRPPRLSRGRGRPDRGGDRPDSRDDETNDRDDYRERGNFERGRGRGRGFGSGSRRGGRGGGGGSGGGDRNFRSNQNRFEKNPPTFDNGPQIDTWTNEISVTGEKEPKISSWGDSKEDWNEDIDSWTGSLAESKVFTASAVTSSEPPNTVQLDSNTFDLTSVLYNSQKQAQNDLNAEANYINQFNQQATESIKNTIGIGSGSNSSLQNSMSSQTASNVSALMTIQNVLQQDSMSVSELTGSSLSGSTLTGNGFVGTSLGNSLTGTSQGLSNLASTVLSGNALSSVAQSLAAVPTVNPTSTATQSAMLQQQQRQKPQRSKLPPPSKIPASAVEMPGHVMTALDVQFGNLEFGTDSSPFSFGGNESAPSAYSSAASSSTSTNSNHVTAQVGQVTLSKTNTEPMIPTTIMSATLEQTSPRTTGIYQQSPYTTPTKQNNTENASKMHSPPEPLQMPGTTDLKSSQLMSGQSNQAFQAHKPSGYSSTKPGSYPNNQYQPSSNQSQSNSSQYSSQYGQRSSQNQYQNSAGSQYQSSSPYQSSSGYSSSQTGYQPSQSQQYQSNQTQYQQNPNQYQNFQAGSTFQNQSFQSNQSNVTNSLYTTTASYTGSTQPSSLYSQGSSHTGSYSNQFLNRDHASGAGASYQATVTQSSSPFKDNQSGTSSYRDTSSNKSRETPQSDSTYSRDTHSASSFSDSQSMAYNRDSQSVGSSYPRDSSSSYKRDSKSASSGAYSQDSQQSSDSASGYTNSRDKQLSASYSGRDNQSFKDSQSSSFRDTSTGASTYGSQAGSYPRDSSQTGLGGAGASQSQSGYSAKNYRPTADLTTSTHQTSQLPSSKVVDSYSKVKETALENHSSGTTQFDVTSSTSVSKSSTSTPSLISNTTTLTTHAASVTTVTSSNTTKISTLPTSSSKAPPNPPPGVPLMAQQYIMGQANTLPFFGLQGLQGLQQPLYANIEDFQFLQQRMPPLATNNVYDMSATAAAGLPLPSTTLTSTQQTVPNAPYSGSVDSTKLTRVDAQSPTGTVSTSQQQSATGQTHQQPQPPYILNYSYYYPPSLIPGAGYQYPMIPMPQVTNAAAHGGSPANSQYQQKNYGSHHMPYGTNKVSVYDDLSQQSQDFSKSPYGSTQSQQKANTNSSVTGGSVNADIQVAGYGKAHAQAFDKQGFHAGTPPPFNLQIPPGQLATGTQAGPLGAHTGPYGAPFVPMMTHQPHSQMMHHPMQDSSSSSRGSQQSGSHAGSKSVSKAYSGANWSY